MLFQLELCGTQSEAEMLPELQLDIRQPWDEVLFDRTQSIQILPT